MLKSKVHSKFSTDETERVTEKKGCSEQPKIKIKYLKLYNLKWHKIYYSKKNGSLHT